MIGRSTVAFDRSTYCLFVDYSLFFPLLCIRSTLRKMMRNEKGVALLLCKYIICRGGVRFIHSVPLRFTVHQVPLTTSTPPMTSHKQLHFPKAVY